MQSTVVSDVQTTAGDPTVRASSHEVKIEIRDVELFYGSYQALHGINLTIPAGQVTAFIGPSGCGKSTLLRSINRMNDLIDGVTIKGSIQIDGHDIYAPGVDLIELRKTKNSTLKV